MVPIEGVIFDLGGVVMGSPIAGITQYEQMHNIPRGYINHAIVAAMPDGAFQRLERGEITDFETFYPQFTEDLEQFRSQTNMRTDFPRINGEDVFRLMLERSAACDPDFVHAIFMLRGSGIRVGALTNNFAPHSSHETINKLMHSLFHACVESVVEGVRKPDPNAYLLACERLGLKPTECAFLDDLGMNLKPAKELGLATVQVRLANKREALHELERLLVSRPIPHEEPPNLRRSTFRRTAPLSLVPKDPDLASNPQTLFWDCGENHGRIVGDVFGHAADPPVILLHGGGQTRHAWGETGSRLASRGYFAIALDFRGHGDSYWSESGYNYTAFSLADELDVWLEATGLKHRRPVLCGASLGGLASMASQFAQTKDLGALVLVDVVPKLEPGGVARIISFMDETMQNGFASLEEVVKVVASYKSEGIRKANNNLADAGNMLGSSAELSDSYQAVPNKTQTSTAEGIRKNLRWDERKQRWFWHWDPIFTLGWQQSNEGKGVDLNAFEQLLLERLRKVTAPTLLVRGVATDIVSTEGIKSLKTTVPHASTVDVADAGHMVAGDRNDVFCDALLHFLDENWDRISYVGGGVPYLVAGGAEASLNRHGKPGVEDDVQIQGVMGSATSAFVVEHTSSCLAKL